MSAETSLRIGDREREQAAERLAAHATAGRLTVEELEQRVARAQAAVTGHDLAVLEADLPSPSRARRVSGRGSGRGPSAVPLVALLALAGLAMVVALVASAAVVGHPVVPPFLLVALVWLALRRGWARREWTGRG